MDKGKKNRLRRSASNKEDAYIAEVKDTKKDKVIEVENVTEVKQLEDGDVGKGDDANKAIKNDISRVEVEQSRQPPTVNVGENNKEIEAEQKEVKSAPFSIETLIQALSIVISNTHTFSAEPAIELVEVSNMQIEKPQELKKVVPELDFVFDASGEWCLAVAKQRCLKEDPGKMTNYASFCMDLHHLIEGTTKEFYRIFRIREKETRGNISIINPTFIGFSDNIEKITEPRMSDVITRNLELFVPRRANHGDLIPVVINPALRQFHIDTQGYILADNVALRDWMNIFSFRKRLAGVFGYQPIYGQNNVRWTGHSAPRGLSILLSALPRINLISVLYSSQFVFPVFNLSDAHITEICQTLQINSNRAEPLSKIVNSTVTGEDRDDFQRIMMAMVLPQQVNIEMEYDPNENTTLNGVCALLSRMLFSTTPGWRNITPRSAVQSDVVIGMMLTNFGYINENPAHPLRVAGIRRNMGQNPWIEMETNDLAGTGWVNDGVDAEYEIENALYDGVGVLPVYGGLRNYINVNDMIDQQAIAVPPIYGLIRRCLNDANLQRARVDPLLAFLEYIRPRWQQFLLNLNRHIVLYGETGFRLDDMRRMEMEEQIDAGGLNDNFNVPLRLSVRASSLYKFFIRLPEVFTPAMAVLRQPIAESLTSAELQRVTSMYLTIFNWIRRDGYERSYTSRRSMKLVIDSILSNHVALRIFRYCFQQGDLQRFDPESLNGLRRYFDDFEAFFFPGMADIIYNNLELFGFTRDVVLDPRLASIPSELEYADARATGIISDNTVQVGLMIDRMTANELLLQLAQKSLRRRIYELRAEGRVTSLPIYMSYREERVNSFLKESDAFVIKVPAGEMSMGREEELQPGLFLRQFLLPPNRSPAFPDQYYLGFPYLSFWYSGEASLTFTALPNNVLADWLVDASSYYDYVIFESPLALETTGKK